MAGDLTDDRYSNEEYRMENLDHIIEVLERWTKTREKNDIFQLGQMMQFPWAPVSLPEEVINSPPVKGPGVFQ